MTLSPRPSCRALPCRLHSPQRASLWQALISRIGRDAICVSSRATGDTPPPPTQARLFNKCLRSITFTMVSVDAGNAFLRRLAIKCGVTIERLHPPQRKSLLDKLLLDHRESHEFPEVRRR